MTEKLKNFKEKIIQDLDFLKEREKEILILRFGLSTENCKTLQEIGNKYNITRERVRQIINHTITKIQKSTIYKLKNLSKKIEKIVRLSGGLLPESILASQLVSPQERLNISGAIEFLCKINPNLKKIKKTPLTQTFWAIKNISLIQILKINNSIYKIIKKANKIMDINAIHKEYSKLNKKQLSKKFLFSIISGSNNLIITSDNKVGLSSWPKINPKNTRDKIYFILKAVQKPLHFNEIAQKISEKKFATKNPTPTTVHNELISDHRFVLIGRGIYALKEWGYSPGSVFDLIKKELKSKKNGLTANEICEKILKKRIISKNTILMNLHSHKIFYKNEEGFWKIRQGRR